MPSFYTAVLHLRTWYLIWNGDITDMSIKWWSTARWLNKWYNIYQWEIPREGNTSWNIINNLLASCATFFQTTLSQTMPGVTKQTWSMFLYLSSLWSWWRSELLSLTDRTTKASICPIALTKKLSSCSIATVQTTRSRLVMDQWEIQSHFWTN